MARFPNLTLLLRTYLTGQVSARVGTRTPDDLEDRMPMVTVSRVGGPDEDWQDHPRVDVECFAGDYDALWDLSESVRDAMLDLGGRAVDGRLVDHVTTESGPADLPYGNPHILRSAATYQLTLRRA